jgi:hypothetical protein
VATLAVGIGMNAAVFTVTNAALFGGFPLVQRNDRIVYVTTTNNSVYYPDFVEWRSNARSFASVALARNIYTTISFGSGDDLDAYFTTEVTANACARSSAATFSPKTRGRAPVPSRCFATTSGSGVSDPTLPPSAVR